MINTHKLGLVFGFFAGLVHVVWSILVAAGFAKLWMDLILKLHFINYSFTIADFSWKKAIALVVITTFGGYIVGNVVGLIWNKVMNK